MFSRMRYLCFDDLQCENILSYAVDCVILIPILYVFQNVNGATIEDCEVIKKIIPYFIMVGIA